MSQHYLNPDDENKPNTLPTLWVQHFGPFNDKPEKPDPVSGSAMIDIAFQAAALPEAERRAFIEAAMNAPEADYREALVAWEGEARECPCNHDDYGGDLDDHGASCAGWYACICIPGCLPDSDWYGPYKTEEDAVRGGRRRFDPEAD